MQFTSLKLAGFKSFVDPSDFRIEPGLTGIVGPNGCGKSNLLEALRWVMGANSAKAMRAGAMDDVIFSGTEQRPARNHAEVVLTIDNAQRTAPSQFNDADQLEISRRINRGAGSSYHINGKSCRAKDVQLLFADASTGANSPALVRQGQINELIAAKPQNRRRVLEEAAGISGLHTRRHEAELRLRAAETNLARLDDIGEEIEAQHQQLKRQVRVASRYRNLAGEIRALESFALLLRWNEAKSALDQIQTELHELEQKSGELASAAARTLVMAETANTGIDDLRQEQAIANALVARLSAARSSVERDAREAAERQGALENRLQEIVRDLDHQSELAVDASQTIHKLEAEHETLSTQGQGDDAKQAEQLAKDAKTAIYERDAAETKFEELTAKFAAHQAQISNAQSILTAANNRVERLDIECAKAKDEAAALTPDIESLAALRAAEEEQETSAAQIEQHRKTLLAQEQKLAKADETVQQLRSDFDTSRRERDEVLAEQTGLQKTLASTAQNETSPIADALNVTPGYERALAVALGDDLQIGVDESAPAHWGGAPDPAQALPKNSQSLDELVTAPPTLHARLSQIGVVETGQGDQLAKHLLPGQRLVSKSGHLWRWDGLQISAEAPSAAALRLEQKNRLAALGPLITAAEKQAEAKRDKWTQAQSARNVCFEAVKESRKQTPTIEAASRRAVSVHQELKRNSIERDARFAALTQKQQHWASELEVANAELAEAKTNAKQAAAGSDDTITKELDNIRQIRDQARLTAADAEAALRAVKREQENREQRMMAIQAEIENWKMRTEAATKRQAALSARQSETQEQLSQAKAAPDEIDTRRKQIFAECETAEQRQKQASDTLAEADSNVREAMSASKMAESAAAAAREAKAALHAKHESAEERVGEITHTISESLGCSPQELNQSEQDLRKIPKDAAEAETRLHKLRTERDNIGGVNLQAEEQAEELEKRLENMHADRDELIAAIGKLRSGVDSLNAEGRTRLLAAFETINEHFKSLFLTLFGGGEAELRLTESDDPLEAGLDIFACPPGKKMGNMSLMSGGEQALTAMALIFAVFLSNPAPVCVLDEVDAPLDDANVERFCTMLDEMRTRTKTRFITITHNPLTMSRVDRLYGVTMAERGVSQLVSVDLQVAENLIAADQA